MLTSKIRPTNSPFLLIVGEPELPPMMSSVETKLNGVLKLIAGFFSIQRGGRLYGNRYLKFAARSYRPPSVVNGVTRLPFSMQPFTAPYESRSVAVASCYIELTSFADR